MKYGILIVLMVLFSGCGGGGDAGGSGGGAPNVNADAPAADPVYTFEITGQNGVRFAATFSLNNTHGTHNEVDTGTVDLTDATTQVYTVNGLDVIANITLISGAGTLDIVFKKNGTPIQSQTITTNATNITMSDGT